MARLCVRETVGISGVVRGESAIFMRHDTLSSLLAPGLLQWLQNTNAASSCLTLIVRGFSLLDTDHPFSVSSSSQD